VEASAEKLRPLAVILPDGGRTNALMPVRFPRLLRATQVGRKA